MSDGRRRRLLALLSVCAVLLVIGRRAAGHGGAGATGPLLVVDHLYQVLLVTSLLAVCSAVGVRLARLMRVEAAEPLDRLLVGVLLGAGAVAVVVLVAGIVGLLSVPVAGGAALALVVWVRRELVRLPGLVERAIRSVPGPVLAAAGLVGALLLARGLAPPTDWDSLMYHLHLPRRFLEEGRIFLPPDTHHVVFVGLAHMLYLPLLAVGGSSAPVLLTLSFALLLPLAVHRLARRLFDSLTAEVSAVAVWGTTAVAMVAVTARVDVTLAVFLVVGHSALLEGLEDGGNRRWLLLGAVLLGLAAGVKYQAGAYVLALSPLWLWTAARERPREAWRDIGLGGLALAAAAAPWFLKNGILVDAPFYPFLAERQLPLWLAELHGSRAVPDHVDVAVFGALAEVREPFSLLDAFVNPERLSPEGEAALYRMSPLLLLLPAWLWWVRDRELAWVVVPGLGYVALVLAVSPRTNLRYLLPAIPTLTIAASALLVRLTRGGLDRLGAGGGERRDGGSPGSREAGRWNRTRIAAVGLAVASLVPTADALYGWLPREMSIRHLVGAQSRTEYLTERRNPALVAQAGLTGFGERPPPEDARVLMMFEGRELYFTVPALQDPLLTNWSLLAPIREELDCLKKTDVTHVLVGTGVLQYYFARGLDPETVRWPEFRAFADRCLEKQLEVPGFVLFRVPGGSK